MDKPNSYRNFLPSHTHNHPHYLSYFLANSHKSIHIQIPSLQKILLCELLEDLH